MNIVVNMVRCRGCGEIMLSAHVHDFVMCKCDNETYADGGQDYLRRGGKDLSQIEELSVEMDRGRQRLVRKV